MFENHNFAPVNAAMTLSAAAHLQSLVRKHNTRERMAQAVVQWLDIVELHRDMAASLRARTSRCSEAELDAIVAQLCDVEDSFEAARKRLAHYTLTLTQIDARILEATERFAAQARAEMSVRHPWSADLLVTQMANLRAGVEPTGTTDERRAAVERLADLIG